MVVCRTVTLSPLHTLPLLMKLCAASAPPLLKNICARVAFVWGFPGGKHVTSFAVRVGVFHSSRMTIVSLMCWYIKFVLRLVWLVTLSWHPLTGRTIYWSILGKLMRHVLGVMFVRDSRSDPLIDFLCYNFIWVARDPDDSSTTHYGYCTQFF